MNKSLLFCLIFLSITINSIGQTVVNSAGGSFGNFDFSLGEVVINNSDKINIGFLQPLDQNIPPSYIVPDVDVPCSSAGFSIPFRSVQGISDGNVGLDFCFEYDPLVLKPTGTATLGSVVTGGNPTITDYFLNITTPGKINGIIYFNGTAPANSTFSGTGSLININFVLVPGQLPGKVAQVKLCGITESNTNGQLKDYNSFQPSKVNIISGYNLSGLVSFWGIATRTLKSGPNYIATTVQASDASCNATGLSVTTDLYGKFSMNTKGVSGILLSRDIPGNYNSLIPCTNIMTIVNGLDQNLAMRIATVDPGFIPTIYQIVASDVNLDGRITASDVTLLNSRTSMKICGFNNNSGGPSRDWVFLDGNDVLNLKPFKISATYPSEDAIGFSKNYVPKIPNCLTPPNPSSSQCVSPLTANYHAVLLGDVNGSWQNTNSNLLRKGNEDYISLNFDKAKRDSLGLTVPITYNSSEPVKSIDFYLDVDTNLIQIKNIEKSNNTKNFTYSWNKSQKTYLLSSYTLNDAKSSGEAFKLILKNTSVSNYNGRIQDYKAFINGEEVNFIINEDRINPLSDFSEISIFPNPVKDLITINVPEKQIWKLTLYSPLGNVLYSNNDVTGNYQFSMSGLSAGLYNLQIKSESINKTFKIVKE